MKRKASALLAGALGVTLLAAGCSSSAKPSAAGNGSTAASGPFKLGLMVPLTGSLAQPGGWIEDGVKYGVKQVNAAGGIDHQKVQLVTVDTGGDPTQSVSVANKLISQDHVQFIIGPITTDAMNAVLPIEQHAGLATIGVVGSPKLTPKAMPYGFSMLLNAGDQAQAMVQYATKHHYKTVAILHDNGEQGLAADQALNAQAKKAGLTVTGDQQYSVGSTDDSAQVLSLKQSHPQAVLLFPTTGTDVGYVLKAMKNVGWTIPVIGGYGAHYADQIAAVSGQGSMSNVVATAYAPFGACPGKPAPAATQKFITGIKAFNPGEFKGLALDLAAASADSVHIIQQGVHGAGTASGAKFATWMETHATSISGLVNPSVSASSSSHFLFGPSDMVLVHPGKQVSSGVFERADC
ncbi:ABC transporter substrate-binding protein [Leekyejoonella antrihumi]|nr:penicillin-binding protein activator [Leekyejoonella antrihumi]